MLSSNSPHVKLLSQLLRYGLVGVISNALLYLLYLLLTHLGTEPKIAMTAAYAIGVAQTFAFNRRWTFVHGGAAGSSFVRYCISYAFGYVVNLFLLVLLVDYLRWSHQLVQAGLTFLIAAFLFLLHRYWVFAPKDKSPK